MLVKSHRISPSLNGPQHGRQIFHAFMLGHEAKTSRKQRNPNIVFYLVFKTGIQDSTHSINVMTAFYQITNSRLDKFFTFS